MRTFLLATLIAPLVSCGDVRPDPDARPNVVFVCMDTVRADHLGCYGHRRDASPNLDALAARSTLFLDATATACWTKPSVPSYLTGTYPLQHGVYSGSARDKNGTVSDALPAAAWTIAEAFSEAGYQTGAFIRNSQLRYGLGFEQGFDVYFEESWDARGIRWRAQDWLDERDRSRPFFLYLHFLDAHWPYDIPDEAATRWASAEGVEFFRQKGLSDAINHGEIQLAPEQLDDLLALYDGAIRHIDEELGRLFLKLEREGEFGNTVICVLSDHGEEFLEHGRIGHGHSLHEELLRVPWILHVPGERPGVVERPVSLVDVFPTVLTAARLAPPSGVGTAVVGVDRLAEPGREVAIFAEHLGKYSYEQSLRRGAVKLRSEDRLVELGSRPPELNLRVGLRYQAALEGTPEGGFVIVEVKEDDDDEEVVELKGPIEEIDDARLSIAGVDVLLGPDVELYGEVEDSNGAPRELEEGLLVKAKGRFEEGRFEPRKIKLYEPGAELEVEMRGLLTGVEETRLAIGGAWYPLAENADLPMTSGRARMTREAVRDAALAATDEERPLRSHMQHFDLASDPGELAPQHDAPPELVTEIRVLARALSRLRFWGADDQRELTAEDLDALREIGYAD